MPTKGNKGGAVKIPRTPAQKIITIPKDICISTDCGKPRVPKPPKERNPQRLIPMNWKKGHF